jgi:hypothetical protein
MGIGSNTRARIFDHGDPKAEQEEKTKVDKSMRCGFRWPAPSAGYTLRFVVKLYPRRGHETAKTMCGLRPSQYDGAGHCVPGRRVARVRQPERVENTSLPRHNFGREGIQAGAQSTDGGLPGAQVRCRTRLAIRQIWAKPTAPSHRSGGVQAVGS